MTTFIFSYIAFRLTVIIKCQKKKRLIPQLLPITISGDVYLFDAPIYFRVHAISWIVASYRYMRLSHRLKEFLTASIAATAARNLNII